MEQLTVVKGIGKGFRISVLQVMTASKPLSAQPIPTLRSVPCGNYNPISSVLWCRMCVRVHLDHDDYYARLILLHYDHIV